MGSYEGMFILSGELEGEFLEKEVDYIKNEIVKQLGEISEAKLLGKRRLAYPIKKMQQGIYLLINFISKPDVVEVILKRVRLNQALLRALIFRKEKNSTNEIRD
ncbi:30S ribosomal protein S6 [bacterium B13(2017)]|nr:30S ribosomal protein S6 [bacterium B13(2017)]